jgi:hypothetical protein
MACANINSQVSIIWVDSDPNISRNIGSLEQQGWHVGCFNETNDALNALRERHLDPKNINCVITSMMERGGRRDRGLLNGLQMLDEMRMIWKSVCSYCPLIAIISLTADEQECKEHGAEIIIIGDRKKLLVEVVDRLNKSSNSEHREKWREPSLLSCLELRHVAVAYLRTLGLDDSYFDKFADRCFCSACEPRRIWNRCGEKYALPIGYYRFGLLLRREYSERPVDVKNWPVAYHGTPKQNLASILSHRRIMFPGDRLDDGTILPIRLNNCHAARVANNLPVIYVSPTIIYSQHDVYTLPRGSKTHEIFKHDHSSNSKNYVMKTIVQCRVKPGCFTKCPETLNFRVRGETIDSEFSNDEVEWVVTDKTGVVPYGLLIGIFPL